MYWENQTITVDDIHRLQAPQEVRPNGRPVSLRRAVGRSADCKLLNFKFATERNHSEHCAICLGELQAEPEERIYIKCASCIKSLILAVLMLGSQVTPQLSLALSGMKTSPN
jgi:hypothetical protein